MLQGNFWYTLFPLFPLVIPFPFRVRGFSLEKPLAKLLLLLLLDDVYMVYAHHGNSKGNPRRQAPLTQLGESWDGKGREGKGTSYCNRL